MRRKAGLGGAWDDEDAAADEEAAEAADLFGFDLRDFGITFHTENFFTIKNCSKNISRRNKIKNYNELFPKKN